MPPTPVYRVRKGLDLPIAGEPAQVVEPAREVQAVGVLTRDFVSFKPRLLVEEGQAVVLGQPLLEDRKEPRLRVVSPATGRVRAVHRGERRHLHSLVVELDDAAGVPVKFASHTEMAHETAEGVRALLLESGLWFALRARPFGHVPAPDSNPHAIFVTALDTNPLAPSLEVALAGRDADFERGLEVLRKLTEGPLFLCRAPGSKLLPGRSGATVAEFAGKHPAGTVGFHIHTLAPAHRGRTVWHLGAQDVARIGHLFSTGTLDTSVVVSLAGPLVKRPRLLKTRLGASTEALLQDELHGGEARVVSGSVFNGDRCVDDVEGYLGRYHQQLSVLAEGRERKFLGWLTPGARSYSVWPTFVSALFPRRRFAFDTNLNGGRRAMVPLGTYERVMPMDLMATHLLRALTVGDLEWAEQLGALELVEEDLALCSFVCPGKYDYGPALRRVLDALQQEQ